MQNQPLSQIEKVILDKSHSRIMQEMQQIKDSYEAFQNWSVPDKFRYHELRKERDRIRKQLGIIR